MVLTNNNPSLRVTILSQEVKEPTKTV